MAKIEKSGTIQASGTVLEYFKVLGLKL
jgi:hypothetical protein